MARGTAERSIQIIFNILKPGSGYGPLRFQEIGMKVGVTQLTYMTNSRIHELPIFQIIFDKITVLGDTEHTRCRRPTARRRPKKDLSDR